MELYFRSCFFIFSPTYTMNRFSHVKCTNLFKIFRDFLRLQQSLHQLSKELPNKLRFMIRRNLAISRKSIKCLQLEEIVEPATHNEIFGSCAKKLPKLSLKLCIEKSFLPDFENLSTIFYWWLLQQNQSFLLNKNPFLQNQVVTSTYIWYLCKSLFWTLASSINLVLSKVQIAAGQCLGKNFTFFSETWLVSEIFEIVRSKNKIFRQSYTKCFENFSGLRTVSPYHQERD